MAQKILSPAEKAWVTRKANAANAGKPMATVAASAPDSPVLELIMVLDLLETDTVSAWFYYEHDGKEASLDLLDSHQRGMCGIRLTSSLTMPDGKPVWSGHGHVTATLESADVATCKAVLAILDGLNRVLADTVLESEDSSFPMAAQALAWHLRVAGIQGHGGTRSTRGGIYTAAVSMLAEWESIHSGHVDGTIAAE